MVVKVFKLGIYGLEIELVWKMNWWHVRMALLMKVFKLVIQIHIGFEDCIHGVFEWLNGH